MKTKVERLLPKVEQRPGNGGRKITKPFSYYDLIDMLKHPGCAVCNLLLQKTDRYMDSMLYELSLDPDVQRSFRERRGLCNEHSTQLTGYMGGSMGVAILFSGSLDEVVKAMHEPHDDDRRGGLRSIFRRNGRRDPLEERLAPTSVCNVCNYVGEIENRYFDTLGKFIVDRQFNAAFKTSDGLCLPHFRMAIGKIKDLSAKEQIISIHGRIWTSLKADLDSFIAKNNYLQKHEISQQESSSWQRVVRIAGERGVFGPDRS